MALHFNIFLVGDVVFNHMPDRLTLTGMVMVAVAGVAIAERAHPPCRHSRSAALIPLGLGAACP